MTASHIDDLVSPDEWVRDMRIILARASSPEDFDVVDALIRATLDPIPFRLKWRLLLRMRVESILGRLTWYLAYWRGKEGT